MNSSLRILHLEDDPNDAALVRSALDKPRAFSIRSRACKRAMNLWRRSNMAALT